LNKEIPMIEVHGQKDDSVLLWRSVKSFDDLGLLTQDNFDLAVIKENKHPMTEKSGEVAREFIAKLG